MEPLIEPIRWLAIGMAIANQNFAKRLTNEVGPKAFSGPSDDGFVFIEALLAELPLAEKVFLEALNVKRKDPERLSDAILRTLREEAEAAWMINQAAWDQKKLLQMAAKIAKDAALLEAWTKRMRTP